MKLSTQEEYGLRCLLQLARHPFGTSLTIPEISQAEGLSSPNVAKLLRILRQGGFVESARGQHGGYALAHPPVQIRIDTVLNALGGRLYDPAFCESYAGNEDNCTHSFAACSVRSLWDRVQQAVDQVLSQMTLQDLIHQGHYKFHEISAAEASLVQISGGE
ncbi:MAG: Rrf2 family transcriptional regulator [Gemmatimonadetes bacterium]|jgi:Rrf2 family protein|nr:Rrf2 family transcriptional regulator [Gemmatimonadota bacterium]